MPKPSVTALATLVLAFSTLAVGDIQITQPASKATILALEPNPVLHWVYTSSDPKLVGITVRQDEDDLNYEPTLMIARGGTPISLGSLPIPLNTVKFQPGMNVTIAITELTDENQNDPLEQKVLVSRGPLRLVEGSNSVVPVETTTDTSAAATSPTSSTSSSSSAGTSATTTSPSSASSPSTNEVSTTQEPTSSPTSEDSAASTSSSNAYKHSTVTALYITMLVLTAIPAFLFGFSP